MVDDGKVRFGDVEMRLAMVKVWLALVKSPWRWKNVLKMVRFAPVDM